MSSFNTTVDVATADAEPPNDAAVAAPGGAVFFKENSTTDVLLASPHVSKSDLHEVPPVAVVEAIAGSTGVGVLLTASCDAQADSNKKKPSRTVRVCVLVSSYEGSDAATKDYDDYVNTPAYWFPPECQGVLMDGKGEVIPTKLTCMSHAGPVAVHAAHSETEAKGDNHADAPAAAASAVAFTVDPHTAVSPQFAAVFGDDTAYTFDTVMVEKKTSYALIGRLVASSKYDCFFNLCDGARDEDRAGVDVVIALEQHGVPFTGARSKYYEWDKLTMKAAARAHGIPTPRCAVIYPHEADTVLEVPHALETKVASLRFPLLFKHPSGYGSIGMGKQSKCDTLEALREALRPFLQQFQSALIEEFIVGDEATVLVCEDARSVDTGGVRVYAPVMCDFGPEAFRHFDMKMETDGVPMGWVPMPPDHPAYGDLVRYSRRAFLAMSNGKGYCRVDWRIRDAAGNFEPQFLEVNPNCGLCYPPSECYGSADYILARDAHNGGGGAAYFMRLQMENAMADARAAQPRYVEQFIAAEMGFGLFAARDLSAGEVVVDHDVGTGHNTTVTAQPAPLTVFSSATAAQDFASTCPDVVKAGAAAATAGRIWALNDAAAASMPRASVGASTPSSAASDAADCTVPLFGVLTGPGALALADLNAPGNAGGGNLCFSQAHHAHGTATPNSTGGAASMSFTAARDIRMGERLMLCCESLRKRYAVLPLQQ